MRREEARKLLVDALDSVSAALVFNELQPLFLQSQQSVTRSSVHCAWMSAQLGLACRGAGKRSWCSTPRSAVFLGCWRRWPS